MFDIKRIEGIDFSKSKIEEFRCYRTAKEEYSTICLDGIFFGNDEIPYFDFQFNSGLEIISIRDDLNGAEILGLEITPAGEKRFSVRLAYELDGERGEMELTCGNILFSMKKYHGKSYRNVYSEWEKDLAKSAYVESAEYFKGEETHELEDGFTLNIKSYSDIEERNPQYHIMRASLQRCELFKNGELFYRYANTDSSNAHTFFGFIHHSNGHRFFPFHIDLYGISYLDLDSGEVYHYIPEGYEHDYEYYCGESFIVTDVHYDSATNLIAYGGCYWAGPYEVMVGDFSEPLSFDPHLVRVHDIIDPEWEEVDDIDFARFENGNLVVKCDTGEECSVSLDLLAEKIRNFE